ncbi:MAG: YlxM family DNA-binding protein, partial [Clostridiales bacterium]|nr:YlxM family DNA-binding protein [Clostridiales bacterium]
MPDTQTRFDLEKIQRMNLLYDFYGELLTPKQSAYLTMYYMDDLSLGEIAKHNGITPQAAADLIKRTGALLEQYEKKLGLIQKHAG